MCVCGGGCMRESYPFIPLLLRRFPSVLAVDKCIKVFQMKNVISKY